jgi:hypothetical protein
MNTPVTNVLIYTVSGLILYGAFEYSITGKEYIGHEHIHFEYNMPDISYQPQTFVSSTDASKNITFLIKYR